MLNININFYLDMDPLKLDVLPDKELIGGLAEALGAFFMTTTKEPLIGIRFLSMEAKQVPKEIKETLQ